MKLPEIDSYVTVYKLVDNFDRKYMIGRTYKVAGLQGHDNQIQLYGERRTVSLEEIRPPTKLEKALT